MNEQKLSLWLSELKDVVLIHDQEDYEAEISLFRGKTPSDFLSLTQREFSGLIHKLFTGKRYPKLGDMPDGDFLELKQQLVQFLFYQGKILSTNNLQSRWDTFDAPDFGPGIKSELLTNLYPDFCGAFSETTREAFKELEIDISLPSKSGVTGEKYLEICQIYRVLTQRLKDAGYPRSDTLTVHYFLYDGVTESAPSGADIQSMFAYLQKYGDEAYNPANEKNTEKGIGGHDSFQIFSKIAESLNAFESNKKPPFIFSGRGNWLTGSKDHIRTYFWKEGKYPDFSDDFESISLFAGKPENEKPYFSIEEEIRVDRADAAALARHADIAKAYPLSDGMYLKDKGSGHANVAIRVFFDEAESYDTLISRLADAVEKLRPVYDKMLNVASSKANVPTSEETGMGKSFEVDWKIQGINVIFYGVPGCGKSHYVDGLANDGSIHRTTFHQDYTYSDFIGQLQPVTTGGISYDFVPGPFTAALKEAFLTPTKPVYLLIEEINRGNAPAIFGDIFQLLDRTKEGSSEFPIENKAIADYLDKNNVHLSEYIERAKEKNSALRCGDHAILLPNNLFIFATMNTCDQSVFPLDNAFKRRFYFERISNRFVATKSEGNEKDDDEILTYFVPGTDVKWSTFVSIIDQAIRTDQSNPFEDKQIGKYFAKGLLAQNPKDPNEELRKKFAMKVFEYLWDDVARTERSNWFVSGIDFDDLIDDFVYDSVDDDILKRVFSGRFDFHPADSTK